MIRRVLILLAFAVFLWMCNIAGLTYTTALVERRSDAAWLGIAGTIAIFITDIVIAVFWIRSLIRALLGKP